MADDATGAPMHAEANGVKAELYGYQGVARISIEALEKYKVRIYVDPKHDNRPLSVRVELPKTGRNTWPAEDVQVVNADGQAIAVRRNGTEWHQLLMTVPPVRRAYFVHVVDPSAVKPIQQWPSENDRNASDAETGLSATVCKWFDGRRTALSIRFDDSHPTHLSKAIPILREYGFKGTFMINPGNPDYQSHRAAWEAIAERGDQEFANHTMHHRGAIGDEEIEREIGEVSQCIWRLFPQKSKLIALNRGGGTTWVTEKPFRYYLDKYHLFIVGGSLGMDDVYGDRVAAFRRHIERHIEGGGWCRAHFHSIGEGLSASETNFRAAMEIVKEHRSQLWIAGMADIYKYQTERSAAQVALKNEGADRATLEVSCQTDPRLFDQPLTIQLTVPESWSGKCLAVRDAQAKQMPTRTAYTSEHARIRFDVAPIDGTYTIAMTDCDGPQANGQSALSRSIKEWVSVPGFHSARARDRLYPTFAPSPTTCFTAATMSPTCGIT